MSTVKKQSVLRDERTGLPLREVRLLVPDPGDPDVRARVKAAITALDPEDERQSMRWIENVSLFDNEEQDSE